MNTNGAMTRLGWMVAISALTGCAGSSTYVLSGGRDIPAARGEVTASLGDNQNTRLVVTVKHLADPEKVVPGATSYVVWVQRSNDARDAQNVGALRVNDDAEGTLNTVTALTKFTLFVTAESSPQAQRPYGRSLMKVDVETK